MLVIRHDQLVALQGPAVSRFETDMLAHLGRHYPLDKVLLGDDGMRAVIRAGRQKAMAAGFTTSDDIARFVTLCLVLGSGFTDDPLLPWASRIVAQGAGTFGTGARLAEEAAVYLELTNGADGRAALVAMLRAVSLDFATATAAATAADLGHDPDPDASLWQLLRHLWPRKHRRIQPAQRVAFLKTAKAAAAADGMDTAGSARLHSILTFLLGADFSNDPALPWARAALTATAGAPARDRARALYDSGVAAVARLKPLLPVVA